MSKLPAPLPETIGTTARKARVFRGLTQEEVAESVGICVQFYRRIERGRALPSVITLLRMSAALGISADALLSADNTMNTDAAGLAMRTERPEIRRLVRRLCKASPHTLSMVWLVLDAVNARGDDQDLADPDGCDAHEGSQALTGHTGADGSDVE